MGGRKRSHWVKTMWQGSGWVLGMLTVNNANLVRAGSHADTGRMGTEKRSALLGDDRSRSKGPGGKLDDRWLKLNNKVSKKAGHEGQRTGVSLCIHGRSHPWMHIDNY